MPTSGNKQFPELLTKADVAQVIKKSQRSIDYMIAAGEIRAIKIGRSVRIPAEEVQRLLCNFIQPSLPTEETSPARTTGMSLAAAKRLRAAELGGDAA